MSHRERSSFITIIIPNSIKIPDLPVNRLIISYNFSEEKNRAIVYPKTSFSLLQQSDSVLIHTKNVKDLRYMHKTCQDKEFKGVILYNPKSSFVQANSPKNFKAAIS